MKRVDVREQPARRRRLDEGGASSSPSTSSSSARPVDAADVAATFDRAPSTAGPTPKPKGGAWRKGKRAFAAALFGIAMLRGGGAMAQTTTITASPTQARIAQMVNRRAPLRAPDEAGEQALLGGHNRPGVLVELAAGDPSGGLALTIHGIHGAPAQIDPLAADAASLGDTVRTYAYDDDHRRLTKSSADLADALDVWMQQRPGAPLRIDAHSMGGRIVLGAFDRLIKSGRLDDRRVELNLMAPPLHGYAGANFAWVSPPGAGAFPNVNPGKDMGTWSGFQKMLERLRVPETVHVRIFTGGRDDIVDKDAARFTKIAHSLNAERIHFDDADHDGTIAAAAAWLRAQRE